MGSMRTRCLVGVLAIAACAHTRGAEHIDELVGHDVDVETSDHTTKSAVGVATPEGVGFRLSDGTIVGFGALERVTEARHGLGAIEGLGIGGATGFVLGAVLGYSEGDGTGTGTGDCFLELSAGDKAMLGGIVFGGLGGLGGLIVGGIHGAANEYTHDGYQAIRPIAPRGSAVGLTVTC